MSGEDDCFKKNMRLALTPGSGPGVKPGQAHCTTREYVSWERGREAEGAARTTDHVQHGHIARVNGCHAKMAR